MGPLTIDIDRFKNNYLVYGLSESDVKRVAELAEFKVATGGDEIVHMGNKECDLYIILEGVAQVCAADGVVLQESSANSVVGEMSLLDDNPRSASVVAKGTLSYMKIEGRKLRRFMAENREVGFIMLSNLSRVLTMRLREASKTVKDLRGQLQDPWLFAS